MINSSGMHSVAFLFDRENNWIEDPVRKRFSGSGSGRFEIGFFDDASGIKGCEIVFILGYTTILPLDFLKRNKLNLIVHESDLPAGKGFSPVQWQVLSGKTNIPVCLLEAAEKVDSGDIILRTEMQLNGDELWSEIRQKQAQVTIKLIEQFLEAYPRFSRTPQSGNETYFEKRSEKDDELNVQKSIAELFNQLRVADNERFPAFFRMHGKKYYLKIYSDK